MPLDIFSKRDVKEHLKDFKKVTEWDNVRLGIMIKYLKIVPTGYKYKMGGLLKRKSDDYVVLFNGTKSWSVQKADNVFFSKIKVIESNYKDEIKKNNRLINELNGDPIELKSDEEQNNDIFMKLRKAKKITDRSIEFIKKKHNLRGWKHLAISAVSKHDDIVYVTLDGKVKSKKCWIKQINLEKNRTIKSLLVVNNEKDGNKYEWTIIPHKYYIFQSQSSQKSAISRALSRLMKK